MSKISADAAPQSAADTLVPQLSYAQIFLKFLRFGLLAWGGPVAQIAMIRRELVEEEHWVSAPRFNRLLAVYQVLPGPEAHELCVFFGTLPGGRLGGFLAGLGFMLPGFLLMFALSWLYLNTDIHGTVLAAAFLGVQPAVIALIVRAVHRIGSHVLLDPWLWAFAIIATVAAFVGTPFWLSLPLVGLAYVFATRGQSLTAGLITLVLVGIAVYFGWTAIVDTGSATLPDQTIAKQTPSLLALFLSGLKAGLLTFGGAYTVIPFLRDDAVDKGWMTDAQFLDGLGLSGILPAPLIIFSTFVGYVGGGPMGAILMTIGIFLPAFSFSIFFHQQIERLLDQKRIRAFLDGVAAAVVGLIAATTLELGYKVLVNAPNMLTALAIFAASLVALYVIKTRLAVLWNVLAAAVAGLLLLGN
jgi:chromate transporter